MIRPTMLLLLTFAQVMWAGSSPAAAQSPRTIRVGGAGTAAVSPNSVVVRGSLSHGGDTAKEAIEKFGEAKEKLADALGGDKHPEWNVEFAGEKLVKGSEMDAAGGAAVAIAAFGGGVGGEAAKKFSLSEEVVVRMKIENDMQRTGIVKQLSGIIDGAAKAGLKFGAAQNNIYAQMGLGLSPGFVQFELNEDRQKQLRARAYAAAYADARTRGEALAKLTGGRLGKAISVEEQLSAADSDAMEAAQVNLLSRMMGAQTSITSGAIDHNGRIEMQQQLVVTFELLD